MELVNVLGICSEANFSLASIGLGPSTKQITEIANNILFIFGTFR